ncbi:MAG: N-acetylmuramoyl-L-alanine amidase [Rhodanobacteraceae bacterium]|jgi:N-acetylmuramoyl-L-alanine amidase|nr:N-acetylmuramoyl-L-alanine amidase [Rhodanobacteraceae bacterium]
MPALPRAARATPPIARRHRSVALLLAIALLAGCAPLTPRNPLATWVPSPNHNARRPVLIVLHATEQDSVQRSLRTLRTHNRHGRVSAHYLIGRDGHLYQLVADSERAWHAGSGHWGSIEDVNSASLGIELDNDGKAAFPPAQIDALLRLLEDLTTRLQIPRTQVIAHADLAPTRKHDPSALFPWQRLADAGFGLWPRGPLDDPPPGFDPWLALRLVGYPLDDRTATVRAFHRHFRGNETDALDEEDLRILHALVRSE